VEPLLEDLGRINLRGIHWIIVGGESGPMARPMSADWVRRIRDRCEESGVPFFFKQWGGVRKKKTGRVLDGRTYDELPPRMAIPVPPAANRAKLTQELEAEFARWDVGAGVSAKIVLR
jgi:protein gp37